LSIAGLAASPDGCVNWQLVKPAGATWVGQERRRHRSHDGPLVLLRLDHQSRTARRDVPLTEQVPGIYAHLVSTRDKAHVHS